MLDREEANFAIVKDLVLSNSVLYTVETRKGEIILQKCVELFVIGDLGFKGGSLFNLLLKTSFRPLSLYAKGTYLRPYL